MTAASVPATLRVGVASIPKRGWLLILLVAAAVLYVLFAGTAVQPHRDDRPLFLAINELRDWIRDHRNDPLFVILFTGPRTTIDVLVEIVTDVLHGIGWPGLIGLTGALALWTSGWRLALLELTGLLAIGVLGLWGEAVDTLGAIVVAVAVALAIGVPIGILMGLDRRVRAVVTPILDVMQIMPTFAYLAPLVLFFGIGGAAATIVTLIYAMPAAIRITALGIRGVPEASVEAGASLGATRLQLLTKVRLPQAGRALGLAVNQAIMLSLSMIVLTALIDAPGLGQEVLRGLIRTDVGTMFDAGIAIVLLAVVLDRLTEHGSRRLDPRHRHAARTIPRPILLAAGAAGIALAAGGLATAAFAEFPDALEVSFRRPINEVVDWLRSDVAWLTVGLKDAVSIALLNPLQTVFTQAPWWLVTGFVAGLAILVSGVRSALLAAAALVLVLLMGLWQHAMETLLQVLVATAITLAIGLVLGVLSARSDRFAAALRPFLDAAQTMPAFVYLIPAFVLFDPSRFTAIFAAVIFAVPPVIRLVDVGIRLVPEPIVEAATSSGASGWQTLTKVRLPVAAPALLLALNQAVILVLSMVVIGGLVGGQALGYDVVAGFSQGRLFGMGVCAGIALVLLGIVLDRVTQGAGRRPALPVER